MRPGRADRVSVVAGVALALLGGILCLDQGDLISLSPGLLAAALCAAAGTILVASGIINPPESSASRPVPSDGSGPASDLSADG